MQLPDNVSTMLMAHNGETAVAVGDKKATSLILKSTFEYARYPHCVVVVTPMAGFYDTGAVFRLAFALMNQHSGKPLYTGETFLNPAGTHNAQLIRNLTRQTTFDLHFFNLDLAYVGSKRIRWNTQTGRDIDRILNQCYEHNKTVAALDFAQAKADMLEQIG